MTRRKIYRCQCARGFCTVRTHGEAPVHCIYWNDYSTWVRWDKHKLTLEEMNYEQNNE